MSIWGRVLNIPAGTRGIQTVDQVRGINVRQRLGGEDLDPTGSPEMFHQISLSSFTTEDVGNLGSSPPWGKFALKLTSEQNSNLRLTFNILRFVRFSFSSSNSTVRGGRGTGVIQQDWLLLGLRTASSTTWGAGDGGLRYRDQAAELTGHLPGHWPLPRGSLCSSQSLSLILLNQANLVLHSFNLLLQSSNLGVLLQNFFWNILAQGFLLGSLHLHLLCLTLSREW